MSLLVLNCKWGDKVVTGAQLRAARGLLNLSVAELSELTGLAINTVRRAEGTNGLPAVNSANLNLLVSSLETMGVLFVPADDLGPGVRLRSTEPLALNPRRRDGPLCS